MKSWKKPTPDQVDRAVALTGHGGHRRFFFDRLRNPEWIQPLFDKGFFQHPPKAVRDEKGETIGFPPWPEAHYLARMAGKNPELVLKIVLKVPLSDNVGVHEDLTEAALAMPASLSAEWARKEGWVHPGDPSWLPSTPPPEAIRLRARRKAYRRRGTAIEGRERGSGGQATWRQKQATP